jgi:hypothetical protein
MESLMLRTNIQAIATKIRIFMLLVRSKEGGTGHTPLRKAVVGRGIAEVVKVFVFLMDETLDEFRYVGDETLDEFRHVGQCSGVAHYNRF